MKGVEKKKKKGLPSSSGIVPEIVSDSPPIPWMLLSGLFMGCGTVSYLLFRDYLKLPYGGDDFSFLDIVRNQSPSSYLHPFYREIGGALRPTITALLWVNDRLFGWDSRVLRMEGFMFHVLSSVMMGLIAFRAFRSRLVSLASAMVFAAGLARVTPMWLQCSPDWSETCFGIATLLAYVWWGPWTWKRQVLVVSLWLGALFSKESGVTIYPMMVWFEVMRRWETRESWRSWFRSTARKQLVLWGVMIFYAVCNVATYHQMIEKGVFANKNYHLFGPIVIKNLALAFQYFIPWDTPLNPLHWEAQGDYLDTFVMPVAQGGLREGWAFASFMTYLACFFLSMKYGEKGHRWWFLVLGGWMLMAPFPAAFMGALRAFASGHVQTAYGCMSIVAVYALSQLRIRGKELVPWLLAAGVAGGTYLSLPNLIHDFDQRAFVPRANQAFQFVRQRYPAWPPGQALVIAAPGFHPFFFLKYGTKNGDAFKAWYKDRSLQVYFLDAVQREGSASFLVKSLKTPIPAPRVAVLYVDPKGKALEDVTEQWAKGGLVLEDRYLKEARTAQDQQHPREAMWIYQQLLEFHPGYLPALIRVSACLIAQNQSDQARQVLQQVLAQQPNNPEAKDLWSRLPREIPSPPR